MSNKTNEPLLSPKFALALQFANEIHSTQARKGLGAPYISHLMAVSGLVMEYGGNETQAIAALLHDAAEDCGGARMLETVHGLFGVEVAEIVYACTDTFEDPKPEWRPRKEAYLQTMAMKPGNTKLVCCADKLHNITNTLRDIRIVGADAWKERMESTENSTSAKQCWYYLGCLEALSADWKNPIRDEFARSVEQLCEMVGTDENVARASQLSDKPCVGGASKTVMDDFDNCESLVNKFGRRLVATRADAVCKRLTSEVVKQLKSMPNPFSEITGVKSIWHDICVQLQYEQSIEWDAYEYEAKSSVWRYVEELNSDDMTCVWLQTSQGDDLPWQNRDTPDEIPFLADDVVDHILRKCVFGQAINSEDREVRDWIDEREGGFAQEEFDEFHQNIADSQTPHEDLALPETYTVVVDDNFHYMDQDERWTLGEFPSYEKAVEACKKLIDEFLEDSLKDNPTAEGLYAQYKMFGDDPYVVGTVEGERFSAWDYAKERCVAIAGSRF